MTLKPTMKTFTIKTLVMSSWLWSFSVFSDTSSNHHVAINIIKECQPDAERRQNQIVLFHSDVFSLSGWNHISDESISAEFLGVALPPERYDFSTSNYIADPTCGGEITYRTVLVKKLTDWHHQHANGLEINFAGSPTKVESLASIIIELKIHSAETVIPHTTALNEAYGEYISQEELLALDNGNINLSITLFEQGANDPSTLSLNASYLSSLTPSSIMDEWIHIEVPLAALDFYKEQNYSDTPILMEDVSKSEFVGIRLNPESQNGKVLRHFLNGQLPDDIPELFKEYHVSIKRVALVTR
ncbi:hypothetical protein [Alteromonas sp. KUL49]|uniref:hypothetical protein n=1 Tax=Alteromonas sp. KUL49 TaxID=2480798 RepID=UPI00102F1297|nr:hypothetical protein [Alteromonas sp. KUL49]TAP41229.1 hypothetical protein EYS00_03250 [Alteromonas sp. KUL49]GEA10278.1 hypothetical protein KUL49_06530 [Alteromonas sp. KUL49]